MLFPRAPYYSLVYVFLLSIDELDCLLNEISLSPSEQYFSFTSRSITLLGAMQHTTFNWTLSYQSMYYMISSCSAWCWIVIWYAHCKYVEQCAEFIEMKLQVIKNDNYLFIYRLHIIIIREPMIRIRVKSSSRQKKYYYILISSEKKPNYE